MDPLDNPVWHAVTGPHASLADGGPRARRYRRDVAPFSALPDHATSAAWDALRELLGPGRGTVLVRRAVVAPAGWEPLFRLSTYQMVATRALDPPDLLALVGLGDDDVTAMLDLVERTNPGPFLPRTIELGRYVGVRDGDRLVAMAGERMRLPGFTEISAVCTDPPARGRGLASALVCALASEIEARNEVPFLHVVHDNVGAIRVYERLGFVKRAAVDVVGLRAPA